MRPDDELELPDLNLPQDDLGNNDLPIEVGGEDDDLTVDFIDEATEGDRLAQNEQDDGYSTEDLGDEDQGTQEQVNRTRHERQELERRYLAQQEELERRLVDSEKRNIATQRDSFNLALDSIGVRIDTHREALAYARQEDDYSAQIKLESELKEMERIRENIQQNANSLADPDSLEREFQQHIYSRRQQYSSQSADTGVQGLNEKANAWIGRNPWFKTDMSAQKSVMAVNDALVAEGYDPNSDAFFGELTRRVAKRHNGLKVSGLDGRAAGNAAAQVASRGYGGQPPVASARQTTSAVRNVGGKRRVTLDNSDKAMLRALGIQDDPHAVKMFAKSKMERLAKEQRR